MNNLCDVLDYAFSVLSSRVSEYDFVYSFPESHSKFPIVTPCVSLGIKKAEIPLSESDCIGLKASGAKAYGTVADCKISVKICVPKTADGRSCYKAFDKIAAACMFFDELEVTAVKCGEISYNRLMGALVLDMEIDVKALLVS